VIEFMVFLPQMRLSFDDLVSRARAAEDAGFAGIAGMDHLAPPLAEDKPMYEAFVVNAWLAAHTERLLIGSLVLCDAFRHPAVLARQAVSLDHASGGRFELGIGWGSVADEFAVFGVGPMEPKDRVQRLRETLEVLRALWSGETVDHDGRFHQLRAARQEPRPLDRIPIVIGGSGPKTLALVREFADWWNGDVRTIGRLDELRDQVGDARVSLQQVVALVPDGADRHEVEALTRRRFGHSSPVIGTAPELVDHFGQLAERGVERVYAWFADFAAPDAPAAFGDGVIAPLGNRV
jgi:alkanesulfonate monooxygenase SsuD/methylene tetrahydromethanopterin reductase-like flavin-dependent oxidoreductase (luciferase family)